MSLDMVKDIVGILSGVIAIVLGLKKLISESTPTSQPTSIIFNIMIAVGVLAIIYGCVGFYSVYHYYSNERNACLTVDSYASSKTCSNRVDNQYNKSVSPSLGFIGSGFVLIGLSSLVRNFKTANWIEYIIEFGLLIIGFLLIRPNF
jgi:hypothetical protein